MQPRYSSVIVAFISTGSIQLLVGPASAASAEQMKVRSSTRATSDGSVRAQKELGRFTGSSGTSVPAATSSAVSRSHSVGEPSHQTMRSGVVSSATSRTQSSSRAWRVGAVSSKVAVTGQRCHLKLLAVDSDPALAGSYACSPRRVGVRSFTRTVSGGRFDKPPCPEWLRNAAA